MKIDIDDVLMSKLIKRDEMLADPKCIYDELVEISMIIALRVSSVALTAQAINRITIEVAANE